jgi:hypothetical protein
MNGYLGETVLNSTQGTPYEGFTASDWALYFVHRYGGIDGAHHKQWVLDQVARLLNGSPVILSLAQWEDGTKEYRFNVGNPSYEYLAWVRKQKGKWIDNEDYKGWEYNWDEGIAP